MTGETGGSGEAKDTQKMDKAKKSGKQKPVVGFRQVRTAPCRTPDASPLEPM